MNTRLKTRIHYFDIAKGILIVLLVFAHFWSAKIRLPYENDYFHLVYGWNSIFTCFYMPAFFIISGYCSNFDKKNREFITNIFRSLILPLFSLSIISAIINATLVTHENIKEVIFTTIVEVGNMWFIKALIHAKIICYILNKFKNNKKILLIITFVLMFIAITLNQYNIGDNYQYFRHGMIASFFVAIGKYFKDNQNLYNKLLEYSLYIYPLLAACTFFWNTSFTAYISVSITSLPLLILYSIFGTCFLLAICKNVSNNESLEFWGRNSLVVYGLHFTPLFLTFKYLYPLINPTNIYTFFIFIVILFTIVYFIMYTIMIIFNIFPFKWLLGNFK